MDKARNVWNGLHMNKHSERHKLFVFTAAIRGNKQFSEKSKKGKVRSLSQMGCHDFTEKQAHDPSSATMIATTKRLKFLNDCNGIHHASVPRKLRSARKKRRCEPLLLDSEKVNHKMNGIESPKKDSIKKSRVSSKRGIRPHWSPRESISGPITKDEQEVAETLYALARMLPDSDSNDSRRELEGKSLPGKSSVLQDLEGNANAGFEALGTAHDSSCCPERSPREASKISSLHENIGQAQHDLPEREEFLMASHSTTPTINLQAMPMIVKSENSNKVPFHDSELCLAMGLNMPTQSSVSHTERKPDMEFEAAGISTFMARDVGFKQEQHMIKDQKENGLALWPGLSPVASAGQDYLQSSVSKNPDWMQAYKHDLMESCSSGGKISEVVINKKSWKRCAAHVHISHIIQSLEVPERQIIKETELYECHQKRAHEGSKGGSLLELHNLNGIRNGDTSVPGTGHFAIVRNPHESMDGILQQQQCHYGVISQAATMPGVYDPQKQSFKILSFLAGNNMLKVDNSYNNKVASRLEPLSKLQDPYSKLLAQQHGLMPIPTPQSQYGSIFHLHQPSVAGPQVRLHQPHYYGGPLCGTHNSSTVSNKQQERF